MSQASESSPSVSSKRSLVIGLVLLVNLVLLVANGVWAWSNATRNGLWSAGAAQAVREAELLEMDLVCARHPLAVFVDRDFANNHNYLVVDFDGGASIRGQEADLTHHKNATRSLELWLGVGFQLACSYSVPDEIEVHDLHLIREGKGAFDLDADGTYDLRLQHGDDAAGTREIWYEEKWQEVEEQASGENMYERKLKDGTRVEFDLEQGKWIDDEADPG